MNPFKVGNIVMNHNKPMVKYEVVAIEGDRIVVKDYLGSYRASAFRLVAERGPMVDEKKIPEYVEHIPARAAYDALKSQGHLIDKVKYRRCHGNKVYLSSRFSDDSLSLSKSEVIALAAALQELAEYMEE